MWTLDNLFYDLEFHVVLIWYTTALIHQFQFYISIILFFQTWPKLRQIHHFETQRRDKMEKVLLLTILASVGKGKKNWSNLSQLLTSGTSLQTAFDVLACFSRQLKRNTEEKVWSKGLLEQKNFVGL